MSQNVFANGREISAKKDDNRSICAMPDVCLSPPSPPAGPVPIPYPNTAMASDTSEGSKTVKIGGQEVGLKNKSNYKTSKGDEAATRTLGMGVVTHTIQGKMKHAAWSMDVKVEGQNVIRHMDLTTHNHINNPNIAVQLNQASQNIPLDSDLTCEELESINTGMRENDLRPSAQRDDVGFTATTATYRPYRGRRATLMMAVSDQKLIRSDRDNGFAPSRPAGQRMACSRERWGGDINSNHTEPKLIEQIFSAARREGISMPASPPALGTLKMNIYHKPAGEDADAEPCGRCKTGICQAVACGLEITLCENGNEKKPPCKDGEWSE
jgi:Domain of unknown function (DUF4150)